ncbi:Uncharacterised protein [Mycobacteroides abscessus subsp. massiliense]|nr:Uncharacterised protein [Mycobacteroides abscessus subsp. massiliense]
MESPFGRYDFGATGKTGQFESGLVGLGAGVAEKDPAGHPQPGDQRLGEFDGRPCRVQIRCVARGELLGDGVDD